MRLICLQRKHTVYTSVSRCHGEPAYRELTCSTPRWRCARSGVCRRSACAPWPSGSGSPPWRSTTTSATRTTCSTASSSGSSLSFPLPDPELPGEERLHALASGMRTAAARHPDAFLMFLQAAGRHARGAGRARSRSTTALRDAGMPEELVPGIERLLSTFVIGFAASEARGDSPHTSSRSATPTSNGRGEQIVMRLGERLAERQRPNKPSKETG